MNATRTMFDLFRCLPLRFCSPAARAKAPKRSWPAFLPQIVSRKPMWYAIPGQPPYHSVTSFMLWLEAALFRRPIKPTSLRRARRDYGLDGAAREFSTLVTILRA